MGTTKLTRKTFEILGAPFEIKVAREGNFQDEISQALLRAQELEKVFNVCDPTSELSLLNQAHDDTSEISADLSRVLEQAKNVALQSRGAYNPTYMDGEYWDLTEMARPYIAGKVLESLYQLNPNLYGNVTLQEVSFGEERSASL